MFQADRVVGDREGVAVSEQEAIALWSERCRIVADAGVRSERFEVIHLVALLVLEGEFTERGLVYMRRGAPLVAVCVAIYGPVIGRVHFVGGRVRAEQPRVDRDRSVAVDPQNIEEPGRGTVAECVSADHDVCRPVVDRDVDFDEITRSGRVRRLPERAGPRVCRVSKRSRFIRGRFEARERRARRCAAGRDDIVSSARPARGRARHHRSREHEKTEERNEADGADAEGGRIGVTERATEPSEGASRVKSSCACHRVRVGSAIRSTGDRHQVESRVFSPNSTGSELKRAPPIISLKNG